MADHLTNDLSDNSTKVNANTKTAFLLSGRGQEEYSITMMEQETSNVDTKEGIKHYSRCSSAGSIHTPNSSPHNTGEMVGFEFLKYIYIMYVLF